MLLPPACSSPLITEDLPGSCMAGSVHGNGQPLTRGRKRRRALVGNIGRVTKSRKEGGGGGRVERMEEGAGRLERRGGRD